MHHSELARRRIETKYLVPPDRLYDLAARLPSADVDVYPLTTVYLDRKDGGLSRRVLETPTDCVKLRVRRYRRDDPHVWVEVKTRARAWVEKQRFAVASDRWPRILSGDPDEGLLVRPCACLPCVAEAKLSFHRFRRLASEGVVTIGLVQGRRQTFRFGELPLRITLDLDLRYYRAPASRFALDPAGPAIYEESRAILEVKRSGLPTEWVADVLAGLDARPYSKFRTLLAASPSTDRRLSA